MDVKVGLDGIESWGDMIIGAEETTGANFDGFNFKWKVKRKVAPRGGYPQSSSSF